MKDSSGTECLAESLNVKILLVEDNPGDARLIREMLAERPHERFEVRTADTLARAQEVAAEFPPAVVLLDLSLPDSSGLETLARAQSGLGEGVAIIILTGLEDSRASDTAVRSGAQEYLIKGDFDAEMLARSIRYSAQRKAFLGKLRENERMMSSFFHNLPGMAFRCVLEKRRFMEFVSEGCRDLLGCLPSDLVGEGGVDFADFVHPADLERVRAELRAAGRVGADYAVRYRIRAKDGTERWVMENGRAEAIGGDPGKTLIEGVILDVTAQESAERDHRRLVSILEATTDFVGIADDSLDILYLNSSMRRFIGVGDDRSDEQINLEQFVPPEMNRLLRNEVVPTARSAGVWEGEMKLRNAEGAEIPVSVVILSHKGADGQVEYVSGIARDITDIHRAQENTERQLQRIRSLRAIDTAISGSMDLRIVLRIVLDEVVTQLGMNAADILLYDESNQTLDFTVGRGFHTNVMEGTHLRLGEGYAGGAAMTRSTVMISDLNTTSGNFLNVHKLAKEGFRTYVAVPLIAKGRVKGVMEIFHRSLFKPDRDWLDFLDTLSGQAAIAIDNAELFEQLQKANMELIHTYDQTLEGWVHALDIRDNETEGHTQRVTQMTMKLAREAGISEPELVHVRRGALLHDIGKLAIPDSILLKPGKLTDEEWVVMRKHPVYAFEWLSPIPYLRAAIDIPYCHHEKWDGSGYPRGLKGDIIPFAARLFALVDVWDALSSDRPYRKAWSRERVMEHLAEGSGSHFDPEAVKLFMGVLSR